MLQYETIAAMARMLSQFANAIDELEGIKHDSLSFEIKVTDKRYPGLKSIRWSPDGFVLMFEEHEHHYAGEPNKKELVNALNRHRAAHLDIDIDVLHALACELSQYGLVYIASISPKMFDFFLKTWSDAYGEDHPDVFMKRHPNGRDIYGFVRTNLTPAQIAAKKNEDGDDDYMPEPLFGNINKED